MEWKRQMGRSGWSRQQPSTPQCSLTTLLFLVGEAAMVAAMSKADGDQRLMSQTTWSWRELRPTERKPDSKFQNSSNDRCQFRIPPISKPWINICKPETFIRRSDLDFLEIPIQTMTVEWCSGMMVLPLSGHLNKAWRGELIFSKQGNQPILYKLF